MKTKIKLVMLASIFVFNVNYANAQIKILSNGNVGINNNTPAYKLDITSDKVRFHNWTDFMFDWSGLCGSPVLYPSPYSWYLQIGKSTNQIGNIFTYGLHVNGIWYASDDSIKTNKRPITNAVQIVKQLTGKQYNYTTAFLSNIPDSGSARTDYKKNQYGFMARELMQVLPELVSIDTITGGYSVNYIEIIPILNEAIKVQQLSIDSLRNIINMQQANMVGMQASIITLQNCCHTPSPIMYNSTGNKQQTMDKMQSNPMLYQNNPNPFDLRTEIKYYLPPSANNVIIVIYNLNGQQLQSFPNLHGEGTQSIIIDGGNLSAGSYYYTLLVDGVEIDTKKMILFK